MTKLSHINMASHLNLMLYILFVLRIRGSLQGDCEDYLVSGPRSMVDNSFPQNGRLYNNIGWLHDTAKVVLARPCYVKAVIVQGCDSNNTNAIMQYRIRFKESSNIQFRYLRENVNGRDIRKVFNASSNCTTTTTFQVVLSAIKVKIKPHRTLTSTQGFRIDIIGCPIESTYKIKRWMSSPRWKNINVTSGVMWARQTGTVHQCSKDCENDATCRSFTYSEEGYCQGHNINSLTGKSFLQLYKSNFYIPNDEFIIDSKTSIVYKMFALLRNNTDAVAYCSVENAQLVVVDTREKLQSLWSSIDRNLILSQASKFYVSGYYDLSGGVWKYWTANQIPVAMWYSGISSNPTSHCLGISRNGLEETDCAEQHYFICERT